jgi:predicted transport protein
MPQWTFVPLEYEKWDKGPEVFVKNTDPISAESINVIPAPDRERQKFFEDKLLAVAWHLGRHDVPLFVDFSGEKRRMDLSCIGYALAAPQFLLRPQNGPDGYLTHVAIKSMTPTIVELSDENTRLFEEHVAYTDSVRRPLLRKLRQHILQIDDRLLAGEAVTSAQRVAYKIPGSHRGFLEIKVQRNAILVRLIETGLADPRAVFRKIPDAHGWVVKNEIRIEDETDAEYVKPFIQAAYDHASASGKPASNGRKSDYQ